MLLRMGDETLFICVNIDVKSSLPFCLTLYTKRKTCHHEVMSDTHISNSLRAHGHVYVGPACGSNTAVLETDVKRFTDGVLCHIPHAYTRNCCRRRSNCTSPMFMNMGPHIRVSILELPSLLSRCKIAMAIMMLIWCHSHADASPDSKHVR